MSELWNAYRNVLCTVSSVSNISARIIRSQPFVAINFTKRFFTMYSIGNRNPCRKIEVRRPLIKAQTSLMCKNCPQPAPKHFEPENNMGTCNSEFASHLPRTKIKHMSWSPFSLRNNQYLWMQRHCDKWYHFCLADSHIWMGTIFGHEKNRLKNSKKERIAFSLRTSLDSYILSMPALYFLVSTYFINL